MGKKATRDVATTRPSTSVVDDSKLYFADNGRVACGKHLGYSARSTGRDISGQRIARVTAADAKAWVALAGEPIQCEDCDQGFESPPTR